MNSKISAVLWMASVSTATVAIYFLYQLLWVPPFAEAYGNGDIRLARVVNAVNHRPAGSIAWGSAEPGRPLQENDAVRAGKSSLAEIEFSDDTRIVLQENSMVIIKALGKNEDGSLKGASLLLDEGQVNFVRRKKKQRDIVGLRTATPSRPQTDEPTEPKSAGGRITETTVIEPESKPLPADPVLRIETKDVAVDIGSSEGSIKTSAESAQLSIDKGSASLDTSKGAVKVNSKDAKSTTLDIKKSNDPGQEIQIETTAGEAELEIDGQVVAMRKSENTGLVLSSKGEAKTIRIPDPPKLNSDDIRVDLGDFLKGAAQLRWAAPDAGSASDTAPQYRVSLYKQGDIATPLTSHITDAREFVVKGLAPGDYMYTVAAIQDTVIGKETIPRALKVSLPPAPALPDQVVELPQSALSESVTIARWQPVDDNEAASYRVRVYRRDQPKTAILTQDVETPALQLSEPLPPGNYQYRVSTLMLGYEGRPSAAKPFQVIDEQLLTPPAPDLTVSDRKIEYTNARKPAKLSWKVVGQQPPKYRLQVAKSATFAPGTIVSDQVLTQNEVSMPLNSGNYHWRVAALAGEKTQGSFSEPAALQVIKLIPPAVFLTSPMKYDLVYTPSINLEGKTDPNNSVKLTMVWAGQEQLNVSADGTYSHQLQLRRGRNKFTVGIRNPAGQVAERVQEIVYLPEQLSKSKSIQTIKSGIDDVNKNLLEAYEQMEKLRQLAQSDSGRAEEAAARLEKFEAYAEKLEFQLKQHLNELEPYLR